MCGAWAEGGGGDLSPQGQVELPGEGYSCTPLPLVPAGPREEPVHGWNQTLRLHFNVKL